MTPEGKMRLLLLGQYPLDDKDFGGVYSHLKQLADYLKKYPDIEVHVVTLSTRIDKDMEVSEGGVSIHYLSSRLPRLIASLGLDQRKIIKKVNEIKPDLIHAHMTSPVYGFPTTFISGKYKILLTVHGLVSEESKTWHGLKGRIKAILYRPMEDYTLRHMRDIIVITEYVKEKISKKTSAKIRVIPLGVSEDYFKAEGKEKPNQLLFVGGIEPRKGLHHLLAAIKDVLKKHPNTELRIVGSIRKKEYYDQLADYVKTKNLNKSVYFTGSKNKEELLSEYGECSVFVLPSQEESEGLVLLEAMASGKPVVAS
ncbi:MAG: glycosyltransferase family 4 protein, partial [Candidatus Altiarchaeota archaeon]